MSAVLAYMLKHE